jgi:uncharacterized protein YjbJ (UPF0337 family)
MNNSSEKKAPTFSGFTPLSQEQVQPVTFKVGTKYPPSIIAPLDLAGPPLPAATDDDEIKTRPQKEQQQQMSLPSIDEVKGKWKQHVGAAKIAWGKLTEDEFLELEGQQQKLTGLVQERYAITRDEADKQVKAFFDKNQS